MENIEIILRDNGTLTERTIKERDLAVEADVLESLTSAITRRHRNVLAIPDWGLAHADVGVNDTVWSVPLDRLPLKARFRLVDGVLVPMFAANTELEMPLVWQVPKEVRLVFVVKTKQDIENIAIHGNWLFAFNVANNGYRLPLPNLYDDCNLCTGEFEDSYLTAQACITASLEQFNQSKWNADLMRSVAESQSFFRFKPTNETFETLPIAAADWTVLCKKISTGLMERVIV